MLRRWLRPGAAAVFAFWAWACGPGDEDPAGGDSATPLEFVDASGATVELSSPAGRVVSLVPSATATLRAMGRDDVLVGRTDYDTQPWFAELPSVGGGLEPNLEAIVALRPDLVVRFAGEQDIRTPARLQDLGIAVMAVRPDRVDDIYRTAELLGVAIDDRAAADSLVHAVRRGLAEAQEAVRPLPRQRVAYVLGGSPPWIAGPDTFIGEVIAMMGGDNAFADLEPLYAAVSPEELRSRPVDVVLVSGSSPFDASLVPGARIERVSAEHEIPGPSVVAAAWVIGERIHGRALR